MDILKSWHLVEFFQPYNIPDINESQLKITFSELFRLKEEVLPWIDPNSYQKLKVTPGKVVSYQIYLNVFDKNEIQKISEQCLGEVSENANIEYEERLKKEGDTCFAKLNIDEWGTPNFAEMSVSTLPWALGNLQRGEIEKMSLSAFDSRNELLREALDRIEAQLPEHPLRPGVKTLSSAALLALLEELKKWAEFFIESDFAFCLDWYEKKKTNTVASDKEIVAVYEEEHEDDDEGDDDNSSSDERIMPILNSFYIEDIEKVINSIVAGQCNTSLLSYLTISNKKKADLYTPEGLELIIKHLKPDLTPLGRWPESPKYNMTLMQQFAINTACKELKNEGLISVNGPPGTGKTTLLRDVIAKNVTERASVLAQLGTAVEGITSEGYLIKELTGYEMVVASSNNAAVENISKELPLVSSLGKEFAELDHYKPLANQLNAIKAKVGLQPLKSEDQCWGVISAVLGKKKNRDNVKDSLFFLNHFAKESEEEKDRPAEYDFLSFWRWNKIYNASSFKDAKANFLQNKKDFDDEITSLKKLERLNDWFNENTKESFLRELSRALLIAEDKLKDLENKGHEFSQQVSLIEQELHSDQINHEKLKAQRPGILSRIFRRKKYHQFKLEIDIIFNKLSNAKKLLKDRQKLKSANSSNITSAMAQVKVANEELKKAHEQYEKDKAIFLQLKTRHKDKVLPEPNFSIEEHELQRNAYWQDPHLNRLRSELFVSALQLQQSWLSEVLKNDKFRGHVFNLSSLLDGKDDIPVKQLWQILFFFVPVVSTTFASLGRMFKSLRAGDLGWLLIDEAGQAVPQAAVGGIWRAKRVIVVGDPLQIEPVFTTPPPIVEAVCKVHLGDEQHLWNPQLNSVQQISDRANQYGCELNVMEEKIWVGIPLWVHRRCIEPMFTTANQIAYEGRMIHGLQEEKIVAKEHAALGENYWLVSKGSCTKKQYKHELGHDTLELLLNIAKINGSLSEVYIISPFKAVKQELSAYMDTHLNQICELTNWNRKEYYKWKRNHVGTVHTFQGKENKTVIFVLGCDPNNEGGAIWAASKPNLLNVALTRAKENIFVVGDPDVWQSKAYFSLLAKVLSKKTLEELKAKLENSAKNVNLVEELS